MNSTQNSRAEPPHVVIAKRFQWTHVLMALAICHAGQNVCELALRVFEHYKHPSTMILDSVHDFGALVATTIVINVLLAISWLIKLPKVDNSDLPTKGISLGSLLVWSLFVTGGAWFLATHVFRNHPMTVAWTILLLNVAGLVGAAALEFWHVVRDLIGEHHE